MMHKTIWITLCGLMLLVCPVWANGTEVPLATVVRALEAPFRANGASAIRDFEGDFEQEAYLSSLDQLQTASGQVAVRFGGKTGQTRFRWEYRRPEPQLIISDGRMVWVHLPQNRQVMESELPQNGAAATSDNPLLFLTGLGNLERHFEIAWAQPRRSAEGHYRLQLKPRQPSALLEKLLLEVDRQSVESKNGALRYPVRAATLMGGDGNRTTIRFRNIRLNRGPADSLFKFVAPPGTEILRPGREDFGF